MIPARSAPQAINCLPPFLAVFFARTRRKSDVLRAERIRRSRLGEPSRVYSDFGDCLPVQKAEVSLLRTFLADEINAILFGKEEP